MNKGLAGLILGLSLASNAYSEPARVVTNDSKGTHEYVIQPVREHKDSGIEQMVVEDVQTGERRDVWTRQPLDPNVYSSESKPKKTIQLSPDKKLRELQKRYSDLKLVGVNNDETGYSERTYRIFTETIQLFDSYKGKAPTRLKDLLAEVAVESIMYSDSDSLKTLGEARKRVNHPYLDAASLVLECHSREKVIQMMKRVNESRKKEAISYMESGLRSCNRDQLATTK